MQWRDRDIVIATWDDEWVTQKPRKKKAHPRESGEGGPPNFRIVLGFDTNLHYCFTAT
jgi:hypothetical protein